MSELVDPVWQESAIGNAQKGYPFATWVFREGRPGTLGASHQTQEQAESFAAELRVTLLSRKTSTVIVTDERGNRERSN